MTGLINPFGQITAQIPQFERGILYGEVVPMHNLTPHLQWRSWPLTTSVRGLSFGWTDACSRMAKTLDLRPWTQGLFVVRGAHSLTTGRWPDGATGQNNEVTHLAHCFIQQLAALPH